MLRFINTGRDFRKVFIIEVITLWNPVKVKF